MCFTQKRRSLRNENKGVLCYCVVWRSCKIIYNFQSEKFFSHSFTRIEKKKRIEACTHIYGINLFFKKRTTATTAEKRMRLGKQFNKVNIALQCSARAFPLFCVISSTFFILPKWNLCWKNFIFIYNSSSFFFFE